MYMDNIFLACIIGAFLVFMIFKNDVNIEKYSGSSCRLVPKSLGAYPLEVGPMYEPYNSHRIISVGEHDYASVCNKKPNDSMCDSDYDRRRRLARGDDYGVEHLEGGHREAFTSKQKYPNRNCTAF